MPSEKKPSIIPVAVAMLLALAGLFTWGVTSLLGLAISVRSIWKKQHILLATLSLLVNMALMVLMVPVLLLTNPPLPGWAPSGAKTAYANWILNQCKLPSIPGTATQVEALGSRNVYVSFRVQEDAARQFFLDAGPAQEWKQIIARPRFQQETNLAALKNGLTTNEVWISDPTQRPSLDEELLTRGEKVDPTSFKNHEFHIHPNPHWPHWHRPQTIQRGWVWTRQEHPRLELFYDLESKTLYLYWVSN